MITIFIVIRSILVKAHMQLKGRNRAELPTDIQIDAKGKERNAKKQTNKTVSKTGGKKAARKDG